MTAAPCPMLPGDVWNRVGAYVTSLRILSQTCRRLRALFVFRRVRLSIVNAWRLAAVAPYVERLVLETLPANIRFRLRFDALQDLTIGCDDDCDRPQSPTGAVPSVHSAPSLLSALGIVASATQLQALTIATSVGPPTDMCPGN